MPRTVTIAEAAALTGLTKTAVRRRVERGSLSAVVRDGVRRIPVSELERQGLIAVEGDSTAPAAAAEPAEPGWAELLDRLVAQERELAEYRQIAARAESLDRRLDAERRAREAAEAALHESRARVQALEAQPPPRPGAEARRLLGAGARALAGRARAALRRAPVP